MISRNFEEKIQLKRKFREIGICLIDLAMHAATTSQQYAAIRKPKMAPPPPEVEIEFAEQLRQPQKFIRTTSSTTASSSPASTLPRRTPKSPSSPFMGLGKGFLYD